MEETIQRAQMYLEVFHLSSSESGEVGLFEPTVTVDIVSFCIINATLSWKKHA